MVARQILKTESTLFDPLGDMSDESKLCTRSVASSMAGDQARDIELGHVGQPDNSAHTTFSWSSLSVEVKSRTTKQPIRILDDVAGIVGAGEMLAIMGPSGSGKTTLLNALANRVAAAGAVTIGDVVVNGARVTRKSIRDLSTYVEQEDALIGSLTVRETMTFAASLALPG